jgi:hypothetical protein
VKDDRTQLDFQGVMSIIVSILTIAAILSGALWYVVTVPSPTDLQRGVLVGGAALLFTMIVVSWALRYADRITRATLQRILLLLYLDRGGESAGLSTQRPGRKRSSSLLSA